MMNSNQIKAVVVDDEPSNRRLIRNMISELTQEIVVVAEADGVSSGFRIITEAEPELVFLDIRMTDGTGFDLLSMFDKMNFEVVFISAFDNYALQAFEFSALDYVLKPIDSDKLQRTVNTVLKRLRKTEHGDSAVSEAMKMYEKRTMLISRIPVHEGNKVILVGINDILYMKAHESYTHFHVKDGVQHTAAKKFSEYEFILERYPNFVKISKGLVVNLNYMTSYTKGDEGEIMMTDGSSFEIARRRKKEILDLLIAAAKK